jgi:hypothetical protein
LFSSEIRAATDIARTIVAAIAADDLCCFKSELRLALNHQTAKMFSMGELRLASSLWSSRQNGFPMIALAGKNCDH